MYIDGLTGFRFLAANPELMAKAITFCCLSAFGQNFIFFVLHRSEASFCLLELVAPTLS